jgi:hypothetical protein
MSALAVTPARVLHSEWHKLWTVRSTWINLALIPLLTVGTALAVAAAYTPGGGDDGIDIVLLTLIGMQFSQITVAVLGVLMTAGEHSTGLIRATMTAVPRRLPVLWSKAAVLAAVSFTVVLATNLLAFPAAQIFLADTDMAASLGDPGIVRALAGNAAGLALLGVMALGVGSLVRSVPAGIGILIGSVMILPEILRMLPYDLIDRAVRYFPGRALEALTHAGPGPGLASPGAALLALALWAAAALTAAGLLLGRRDV